MNEVKPQSEEPTTPVEPTEEVENSKNDSSWGGARPGAGRPPGSENQATKDKKAVEQAFSQRVMTHVDDLFNAQLNIAKGESYLYRIDEEKDDKGRVIKREHVIVTDPDEIRAVLDEVEGTGVMDEKYYYITTQKPDNRAIDSLLDRVFGKAKQKIGLEGEDGQPVVVGITYIVPKNESDNAKQSGPDHVEANAQATPSVAETSGPDN